MAHRDKPLHLPARFAEFSANVFDPELLLHGVPKNSIHVDADLEKESKKYGIDVAVITTDDSEQCTVCVQYEDSMAYGEDLFDALQALIFEVQTKGSFTLDPLVEYLDTYFSTTLDKAEAFAESLEEYRPIEDILYGTGQSPDNFDVEQVLRISRCYRAAEGPSVDDASKFCQQQEFDDDDVSRKFENFKTEPGDLVLMAGFGDFSGRTHAPFDNFEALDPRIDGRRLTAKTDLSRFVALASDIDEDVVEPMDVDHGMGTMEEINTKYEQLHAAFPHVRMALKLNICNLPNLPLKLQKKPRPHNAEVVCEVVPGADMSWVKEEKRKIIEANWIRNRFIREGKYPVPIVRRAAMARLFKLAERAQFRQEPKLNLIPKRGKVSVPVNKADVVALLGAGRRVCPVDELAVTFIVYLLAMLLDNAKKPINLLRYPEYYAHPTAEHVIATFELAATKYDGVIEGAQLVFKDPNATRRAVSKDLAMMSRN